MRRARWLWARLRTVGRLLAHFARRQKFVLLPLMVILLLAGLLLIVTGGMSYVAPFIYSIF